MMNTTSSKTSQKYSEQKGEAFIANLVRLLVICAGIIVAGGGVLFILRLGNKQPGYHLFTSEPVSLMSVHGILTHAFSFDSQSLIQLGILLLIGIPIIRVFALLISFFIQRDWIYVVTTILVFGVLLFSLFGSAG